MSFINVLFFGLAILAAVSAVAILLTRNVFHAALLLVVCLLAIAGIYIIANAELLAVTQILIYAGGVLVLIIFGIMLTSKISGRPLIVENKNWIAGAFVGLFFMSLLTKLFSESAFYQNSSEAAPSKYNSVNQIGILFSTDFVIPFEVTGILLLVVLIAAAVVASSFNTKKL
jgi:NADH:ubiquinone oxidoreductase subunit 6 (subunit J)